MKKIIAAFVVFMSLFISPVTHAEQHHFVPVHALQVITGRDLGMPVISLKWGDSITYELDPTARLLFKFKSALQAITILSGSNNVISDLIVTRSDSQLTVTIKDDTGPWVAKATLFFLPLGNELPALGGLDPTIPNTGGPRF